MGGSHTLRATREPPSAVAFDSPWCPCREEPGHVAKGALIWCYKPLLFLLLLLLCPLLDFQVCLSIKFFFTFGPFSCNYYFIYFEWFMKLELLFFSISLYWSFWSIFFWLLFFYLWWFLNLIFFVILSFIFFISNLIFILLIVLFFA